MNNLIKNKIALSIAAIIVIVIIVLIVIPKNAKKEPIKIKAEYAEFVSAVTSGVISVESTIKVVLINPFSGDSLEREKVLDGLFGFSPGISGHARWTGTNSLEFIPTSNLKSGTYYEVSFQLDKVAKVPNELSELKFSFQTIKQDFTIAIRNLCTYGSNASLYNLKGEITSADVTDNAAIEKIVKVTLGEKEKILKWQHRSDRKEHIFVVDSIERTSTVQQLNVHWDGNPISVKEEVTQKVEIPATGDFKVIDVVLQNEPDQVFTVYFSDPLSSTQNLEGLITLENVDIKLKRYGNQVNVYPGRLIAGESHRLKVSEAIENFEGKKLPSTFYKNFGFSDIKPAVELVGKGVIMPLADSIIMPFKAVNLKAVDVTIIKIYQNNIGQFMQDNNYNGDYSLHQVGRPVIRQKIDLQNSSVSDLTRWHLFSIDLGKLIKSDPGAIYKVTISFRKSYSLFRCEGKQENEENEMSITETSGKVEDEEPADYGDSYYSNYDYEYNEEGDNNWQNRDNPCYRIYFNRERFVSRNVFFSNIGLIAKTNTHNDLAVIVTGITDAHPLSGVEIEAYDYQHQILGKQYSDSRGFAILPCSHKPFLIVARKGNEFGYLALKEGQSLSLSMFDVSGQQTQKGLKGFIYGERGVWRPGDTLFLTFILEDKNNQFPKGHPVIFELTDPRNQLFKRQVKVQNVNGFYTFFVATPEEAPTGNWLLTVKAGGANFTKTLKIETIKPNRLAIDLDFGHDSILKESLHGTLTARWLHGAVAANLKSVITMRLSSAPASFRKFPDFEFSDPTISYKMEEQTIFQGALDGNGKADIYYNVNPGKSAPGMLKLSLITKVFEDGGNFSIDYYTTKYSPFNYYAGISLSGAKGVWNWLYCDMDQTIKIASVDYLGKPVSRQNIKVDLYKFNWNWWWERSEEDMGTYINSDNLQYVSSQNISTQNGYGSVKYKIEGNKYGTYFMRVTDPDGHSAGKILRFYNPWYRQNLNGNHPEAAAMLVVSTDKPVYAPGEKAHITIPATENTQALVSIESGSKIIDMFWSEAKPGEDKKAVIDFNITEEMAPNAFVNVMLIQPYRNTGNDLPLRLFGYAPIMIENPATRLVPVLKVPEKIGSEEQLTIKVSEKQGRDMTYTLAIVDEGLLNITRFKAPNPWDNFYAREALGINTWDIYNFIFGGVAGKIEHLFAVGGDQEVLSDKGSKTKNRFTPVVKFMGPFELKKGAENSHTYRLPKYSGAIRAMVVAGNRGAYGTTEKTILVKNPLMVVATLPRVLGPGEEVMLPVTIFADDPDIKDVNIEVQTNSLFSVVGQNKQVLSFSKTGNKDIFFNLKTRETIGQANVKVLANSGKFKADYEIDIMVRNANENEVRIAENTLEPTKNWQKKIEWFGIAGTNKADLEISSCPPLDLKRRLSYLIGYPHGCIEQTTSSVFPQLFLDELMDLSDADKFKTETNIKAGIERLKLFQNSYGAFTFWPGENYVSDWGCSYAGHFIIEAEKKGYALPEGMLKNWIKFQKNQAVSWPAIDKFNSSLSQAYCLMTLALAGSPEMGAMNRLKENSSLPAQSKWMLAWAYSLAGQKETAKTLINNLESDFKSYRETGITYGSPNRDIALVIPVLCNLKDYDKAWPMAEKVAKVLSSQDWLSTQETAFGLIAISSILSTSGKYSGGISCQLSINGKIEKAETRQKLYTREIAAENLLNKNIEIQNNGKTIVYLRLVTEGIPLAGNETETASNLNLNIRYTDAKGNELDITKLKQGQDFKAVATIINPASYLGNYQNLALSQVFPSGWEIINTRLADMETTGSKPDYQDIRDDRIYTYFGLFSGKSVSFEVLLNASYAGKFYLPAIHTEAMYDNNIRARKIGRWVEVIH